MVIERKVNQNSKKHVLVRYIYIFQELYFLMRMIVLREGEKETKEEKKTGRRAKKVKGADFMKLLSQGNSFLKALQNQPTQAL